MPFLKITSQTPLICHGDGIITELSAEPSHSTPERINVRNNQNTSPEPTGKHMLIPYSCLQHFSWTHLTSWSRFVITYLKIHLGCSQQESRFRERTVYSVPCLPCVAMLWQSPSKHGIHMLNLHLSETLPVPFSDDRTGHSKSHTHCWYSETNTWQHSQPSLMYNFFFVNYLLCGIWFI